MPFLDFLRGLHPATGAQRHASYRRHSGSKKNTVDASAVRARAAENGIEVSPRGRIRQQVLDQYSAART